MTEQTINMCRYKQINLSIDTDIYNIQIRIDKVGKISTAASRWWVH